MCGCDYIYKCYTYACVFGFNETYLYMDKFGKANGKLYFFILFILQMKVLIY